jgi:uncharacterized protein YcgI (DUF1989 family)
MEGKHMTSAPITIPARGGKAARVAKGQTVTVINTHGEQVVDTWAFNAADVTEFMSMEASRAYFLKLSPGVGDCFVTNRRQPVLTVVEDSSPGVHDTLLAACDRHRYALLGVEGYHDNCTDNLTAALAELDLETTYTPGPLNLFMNIPWTDDGGLSFEAPVCKPGDYISLRAEIDLVIAFSACPQDLLPVNGVLGKPTEAHFRIS